MVVVCGYVDFVIWFYENGVDVSYLNCDGFIVFYLVVFFGWVEVIKVLFEVGVDFFIIN